VNADPHNLAGWRRRIRRERRRLLGEMAEIGFELLVEERCMSADEAERFGRCKSRYQALERRLALGPSPRRSPRPGPLVLLLRPLSVTGPSAPFSPVTPQGTAG